MKRRNILRLILAVGLATELESCTGLMMSTDFGADDYGYGSGNWYWPSYGNIYNGPGPWYGPGLNTPPPPPVVVVPQPSAPNRPSNGANRPNGSNQSRPNVSAPASSERPGNMGQGPSQSSNHSSADRGR